MKKLMYVSFVATVLLISGLARAAELDSTEGQYATPAHVEQVAPGQIQNTLVIAGYLPTPCHTQPAALLENEDSKSLLLRLTTVVPNSMCITKIKPFMSTLDLKQLAHSSRVKIDTDAIYQLKVDGSDFVMEVRGSDLK